MFKVVTDQLKVSQGWVRCGHCTEVFDASLNLQTVQTPAAPRLEAQPASPVDVDLEAYTVSVEPPLPKQALVEQAPAASVGGVPVVGGAVSLESSRFDPQEQVSFSSKQAFEVRPEKVPDDLSEVIPGGDVSFVRDAKRQAFWRKPVVRIASGLTALVLVVLLVLQFSIHQRDSLAAREPRLKPWLQALCEPFQCEIAPVRHIEAVVIDSSSFNKLSSDTYRLSFSLKNTWTTPVAMPSLEVTLTDTQEQAVVRRVVTPVQFGVTDDGGVLRAGSDFSGVVVMQVSGQDARAGVGVSPLATGPLRVAGYRVLAFYP